MPDTVQFWFDPVSPWCWTAARWIQVVETEHDIELTFHIMSLALLNDGKQLPPPVRTIVDNSWPYLRVLAAVETRHGQPALRALYNALGSCLHEEKTPGSSTDILTMALRACDLDSSLAAHADTTDYDSHIATSHKARSDDPGTNSGAPTIRIDGNCFFGPAISRVPDGQQAVALYGAIRTLATYPYIYEYQRARTEMPKLDRAPAN
ncbi:DsbA family protein [Nocardia fluminea]|uniref:DsbA family protein n=1 Tax=Nocardia fluminea TaxID=134984 RepID=UPI0033C38B2C